MEWIRALYYEMAAPQQPLGPLIDDVGKLIPAVWYDDANSLVTHLLADAGQVSDRRVRVVVAALREMLSRDDTKLEWIDTAVQLADALTKLDAERGYLLRAFSTGTATVIPDSQAVLAKEQIRAARHRRADEARRRKATERGAEVT